MDIKPNNRIFASNAVPIGTVVAFAGKIHGEKGSRSDTPPVVDIESSGWMECDGRWLLAAQYSDLFGVIGFLYGKRLTEKGNEFRIPDYRGQFLRGVDNGAGVDPDAGARVPPEEGQGKPDEVGSIQGDALQTHKHQYQKVPSSATGGDKGAAASPVTPDLTDPPADQSSKIPGDARVSSETRPQNVYVNYIINFGSRQKRTH